MKSNSRLDVTVEEVCRRYLAGESIDALSSSLGVCSWTICDRMKKGGIKAFTERQRRGITPDILDSACREYSENSLSVEAIKRKYKVDQTLLHAALRERGLAIKQNGEWARRHHINSDFWSTDSDARDYWLGFSMADGCVTDRRDQSKGLEFKIGVSVIDSMHISKFNQSTMSSYPISVRERKIGSPSKPMSCVSVFDQAFCEGAISVGIIPRKTYSADVEEKYLTIPFFRGLIDGDGSVEICAKGTRPSVRLSGHKLSKLPDRFTVFCESLGLKVNRSSAGVKKQAWTIAVLGSDAVRLARILYSDAPEHLRLDRKYESWKKIEELVDWKAKNCKSGSGYGFYAPVWTEEQKAIAKSGMKSEYKASGTVPPSRKGVVGRRMDDRISLT